VHPTGLATSGAVFSMFGVILPWENTSANLTQFDGKNIGYWFVVTDVVGAKATSTKYLLSVDTTAPIINQPIGILKNRNYEYFN
jgi:hypothetical protein